MYNEILNIQFSMEKGTFEGPNTRTHRGHFHYYDRGFFTVFDKCHRSEHIFQPLSDYFLSISVNNIVQIICCISILAQSSKAL